MNIKETNQQYNEEMKKLNDLKEKYKNDEYILNLINRDIENFTNTNNKHL